MTKKYIEVLNDIAEYQSKLSEQVPQPQKVIYKDAFVYRYLEESLEQALIQKLARLVTGLRALYLLYENGLYQEQSSVQRIVSDITEDVEFLAFSKIYDEDTCHHKKFIEAFYADELLGEQPVVGAKKINQVERKKIRAYIDRISSAKVGGKPLLENSKKLHEFHSGFLHAHSTKIMDMYFGNPPYFHLNSMSNSHLQNLYLGQLWDSFYNGVLAFCFASEALNNATIFDAALKVAEELVQSAGKNYLTLDTEQRNQ